MRNYKKLINKSSALLLAVTGLLATAEYSKLEAQEEVYSNSTIEEIAEEEATVGKDVTVRGNVVEVEPGISFTLEEEGLFEGDKVLVINVSNQTVTEATEDMSLQVTGEVGNLVIADVERDYGLDLDPELYVEYENKPVIFAKNMVLSPEIEDVTDDPEKYYGQVISLEGAIDDMNNNYAFNLKEEQLIGGGEILILNVSGKEIPQEGETVVVTGMVRPYVKAEFETEYNLTWDLDIQEQIEAEYTNKPVFILDNIYPSAKEEGLFK